MIWSEWVNSEYNTEGMYIAGDEIFSSSGNLSIHDQATSLPVEPGDIIQANWVYYWDLNSGWG